MSFLQFIIKATVKNLYFVLLHKQRKKKLIVCWKYLQKEITQE